MRGASVAGHAGWSGASTLLVGCKLGAVPEDSMGIVENIKDAADLAKKVGDLELYRKIVHLEGEVMDLTREKRQAEQKIEELQKQVALKAKMAFKEPFYYQDGDAVPFCPRCYERDAQAVHLFFKFDSGGEARWDCPDCKQMYLIRRTGSRRSQITPEGW